MSSEVGSSSSFRWRRIGSLILPRLIFYPFLLASLLVFPAGIPVMILAWLLMYANQRRRGKPSWRTLGICLVVLLIKRVDWTPALLVLGVLMAIAAILDGRGKHRPATIAAWAFLPAWIVLAWTWSAGTHTTRTPALQADRPIVCLGDSLSSGGYVRILGSLISVPAVDKSQGGITTVEGRRMLPEVLAMKPQAVVLELGGHDYLRGKSRRETRENLEAMIRAIRDSGAEVVLFEVPRSFVSDPYWGLDRQLARDYDLELVHDGAIRQLVVFSPFSPLGTWTGRQLSYDGLHPNDAGNVFLAGRVAASLRRVFGDAILRSK
jgi:hypothetical protein